VKEVKEVKEVSGFAWFNTEPLPLHASPVPTM